MPPLESIEILAEFAAKHAEHIYPKNKHREKKVDVLQAANRVFNYLERKKALKEE